MADNVTAPISEIDLMSGKPACGSGQEVGEYDLGLHVAALCKSRWPLPAHHSRSCYRLTTRF